MSEKHIYPYQCEGEDCPLCYLDSEIERLEAKCAQRRDDLKQARDILDERFKRIEDLEDEIVNLEALAKDRYCAMQTKIEVFYDAIYEIAYLDPIRRIQGDAQRIARQALENYYSG